ncbi:transporter [Ganoderma sinense ZZ0214-1]|uniref:Transporter n=1 Tax=Ganoderma sinense ZZ0214-1 TaxID=1077348 RepID=A0A2G8S0T4_9APHY|nr:transporter [Ganoderma sinense ZZ0214-1]
MGQDESVCELEAAQGGRSDVFGNEDEHDIRYKTLSWQFVSALMIAEIVSNGMLTLPNAMAVVGIIPSVILTVFLGIFALWTAKLLIDFKHNHPEVHNMGDAGFIMFGPIGREVFSIGSIIFAIFAVGAVILSGQQALSVLSDNGLCATILLAIFSAATFVLSLPRTLAHLSWLGLLSASFIALCGLLAMVGAGANPVPGRIVVTTVPTNFYQAFLAITGPVFSYAGHFMFFVLISEMRRPQDAMKAACVLQGFATTFYAVFSVVVYAYIGSTVASPALFSLPPVWAKITFGVGMVNFLITGAIYAHTAAKLVFIRLFRGTQHVYTHTILGWTTWVSLCFASVGVAFVLASAVPIFPDLTGITASLFASWYTYGVAGFFWLYDAFHLKGGLDALKRRWFGTTLAVATVLAGAFICLAHYRLLARTNPARLLRDRESSVVYTQDERHRNSPRARHYYELPERMPGILRDATGIEDVEMVGAEGLLAGGLDKMVNESEGEEFEPWVEKCLEVGTDEDEYGWRMADHVVGIALKP